MHQHEVAAMLRAGQGGSIVKTSSWLATGAMAGSSAYPVRKGALDAMVRAVALGVGSDGIRNNNVSPGIIDTPMFRRFAGDEPPKPFAAFTPVQRLR